MTVFRDLTEVTVFLSLFFFFHSLACLSFINRQILGSEFVSGNPEKPFQLSIPRENYLVNSRKKQILWRTFFCNQKWSSFAIYQAHGTWHTSTPAKGTYTYSEGWPRKGLGWLPEDRWKDFLVSSHSNIVFHMLLPIFLSLPPFPALLSSRSGLALWVCVCVCVCVYA